MKKSASILAVMLFCVMSAFPSNGAQMTSQIQRLLEQKEEKIKKLEECEGKKKGWMIAGLSTIGVTAVGVGVNIAQASKSNKLSGEIDAAKTELERQQDKLSGIESQIAQKEREKAERERQTAEEQARREREAQEHQQSDEVVIVGGKCGENDSGVWTIDETANQECTEGSETHKCKCVVSSGGGSGAADDTTKEGKEHSETSSGSSSSSNTGNNSTSATTGGSANSKSVKTNNGGKGSSSVDKTGEKAGTSSGSSSSSNTGNNSTSATTGVNTGSSSTSVQGDCIIEKPNTTLPEGCVCDASKGLVERWITTMFGGRSNKKECKCDSGTRWNGQECLETQTVRSATSKSVSKNSESTSLSTSTSNSGSSSSSNTGNNSTSATTGVNTGSSSTSVQGDCIIEKPNTTLPEGCVCDASKGLVERYLTTMGGKRSKNKECKCDSGTRWDGRENMCI